MPDTAGSEQKLAKWCRPSPTTQQERRDAAVTPTPHCPSAPIASGKAKWHKLTHKLVKKHFSSFVRERSNEGEKILRANPRTQQRDLRDSEVPSRAAGHVARHPGPRRASPRHLPPCDRRADPDSRDARSGRGRDTLLRCVVSPSCRLYVASGRASGTRKPPGVVSWSQSKQGKLARPVCRLSVVRGR